MRSLCVLLAEESPLFRSALAPCLRRLGFAVMLPGQTCPGSKNEFQPDLVLLDAATIGTDPQRLEDLVRQHSAAAPVLLLAPGHDFELIVAGLKGGAMGFVLNTAAAEELQNAVVALASGRVWCDACAFQKIMQSLPALPSSQAPIFTRREKQVLELVCRGESNKEIAQRLNLSEQSIKVYVSNLLRKTRAPSRSGLAFYTATRPPTHPRSIDEIVAPSGKNPR